MTNLQVPPYSDPPTWTRFVAAVRPILGGCHLWTGPPRSDGYGQFWVPAAQEGGRARVWRAHRYAWTAWHGPIPPGRVVMHECDEPLCAPADREVVDEHLRLGTVATNNQEMRYRGRDAGPRQGGVVRRGSADPLGQYTRSWVMYQALVDGASTQDQLDAALAAHRHRVLNVGQVALFDLPG